MPVRKPPLKVLGAVQVLGQTSPVISSDWIRSGRLECECDREHDVVPGHAAVPKHFRGAIDSGFAQDRLDMRCAEHIVELASSLAGRLLWLCVARFAVLVLAVWNCVGGTSAAVRRLAVRFQRSESVPAHEATHEAGHAVVACWGLPSHAPTARAVGKKLSKLTVPVSTYQEFCVAESRLPQ